MFLRGYTPIYSANTLYSKSIITSLLYIRDQSLTFQQFTSINTDSRIGLLNPKRLFIFSENMSFFILNRYIFPCSAVQITHFFNFILKISIYCDFRVVRFIFSDEKCAKCIQLIRISFLKFELLKKQFRQIERM